MVPIRTDLLLDSAVNWTFKVYADHLGGRGELTVGVRPAFQAA
jgi:hypothetical protein